VGSQLLVRQLSTQNVDAGPNLGDARYWRALNEVQLERHDEAWTDIELAALQRSQDLTQGRSPEVDHP
jgi:hypothetical protein